MEKATPVKLLRIFPVIVAAAALGVIALRMAFPLPDRAGMAKTTALPASAATALGAAVLLVPAARPGTNGVTLLAGGGAAFAARVAHTRAV